MKPFPILLPVVAALLTGCTTWQTTTDLDQFPMPTDSAATVDVWGKDGHQKLRAVRIDADSVRGLPVEGPALCDSCRVAIPRSAVDSIRSVKADGAGTGIMGVVIAVLLLPLILISMMPET
jgi:hypothetical protein